MDGPAKRSAGRVRDRSELQHDRRAVSMNGRAADEKPRSRRNRSPQRDGLSADAAFGPVQSAAVGELRDAAERFHARLHVFQLGLEKDVAGLRTQ